jgi:hypothetical protein
MLRVVTQNSTYEFDTVGKRVRRLSGDAAPTARQGPDHVWKDYTRLDKVLGGYLIDWDGKGHCTLTSQIVSEDLVAVRA